MNDPEAILEQILADPELSQHVVRSGPPDSETQVAYYRCRFEPGRQRYTLHVPLTPPMNRVPQVQSMVMEGEEAKIRVTDCQKFGIRAEVILDRPADSEKKVLVEVIAYLESL